MSLTTRNWGASLLLVLATITSPAMAGGLDAPGAPAAGSGMPSTADIYNRLNSGAPISVAGTFQEPASGPTAGTGKTLGDIAAKLPAPDNMNGAVASDVANGKTFWGLRTDGTWGLRSGTLNIGVTGTLNISHVATFTCDSHWSGASCNVCAGQWSGTNCDMCPSGWTGPYCDAISKPFPSAVPNYTSTPWNCVADSATGLTWDVKTTDAGLHDRNRTYTWYDSTAANPGTASSGSCTASSGNPGCDTEKYVAAVNVEKLCGYTNWRLPTESELRGLLIQAFPAIDSAYFPSPWPGFYWTNASEVPNPSIATIVDFSSPGSPFHSANKAGYHYVRLVRSGP